MSIWPYTSYAIRLISGWVPRTNKPVGEYRAFIRSSFLSGNTSDTRRQFLRLSWKKPCEAQVIWEHFKTDSHFGAWFTYPTILRHLVNDRNDILRNFYLEISLGLMQLLKVFYPGYIWTQALVPRVIYQLSYKNRSNGLSSSEFGVFLHSAEQLDFAENEWLCILVSIYHY